MLPMPIGDLRNAPHVSPVLLADGGLGALGGWFDGVPILGDIEDVLVEFVTRPGNLAVAMVTLGTNMVRDALRAAGWLVDQLGLDRVLGYIRDGVAFVEGQVRAAVSWGLREFRDALTDPWNLVVLGTVMGGCVVTGAACGPLLAQAATDLLVARATQIPIKAFAALEREAKRRLGLAFLQDVSLARVIDVVKGRGNLADLPGTLRNFAQQLAQTTVRQGFNNVAVDWSLDKVRRHLQQLPATAEQTLEAALQHGQQLVRSAQQAALQTIQSHTRLPLIQDPRRVVERARAQLIQARLGIPADRLPRYMLAYIGGGGAFSDEWGLEAVRARKAADDAAAALLRRSRKPFGGDFIDLFEKVRARTERANSPAFAQAIALTAVDNGARLEEAGIAPRARHIEAYGRARVAAMNAGQNQREAHYRGLSAAITSRMREANEVLDRLPAADRQRVNSALQRLNIPPDDKVPHLEFVMAGGLIIEEAGTAAALRYLDWRDRRNRALQAAGRPRPEPGTGAGTNGDTGEAPAAPTEPEGLSTGVKVALAGAGLAVAALTVRALRKRPRRARRRGRR